MKKTWIAVLLLFSAALWAQAQTARWVKGNTHTHTNRSDGEEYPHRVARWYQDHGYQFLFITDHDMVTATASLDADGNATTSSSSRARKYPSPCSGARPMSVRSIPSVLPAPGWGRLLPRPCRTPSTPPEPRVASPWFNHPFRRWSLTAADMKGLRGVHLL